MTSTSLAIAAAPLSQPDAGRDLGQAWFERLRGLWEFNPRASEAWGVAGNGDVVYGRAYGVNRWEATTWTHDGGAAIVRGDDSNALRGWVSRFGVISHLPELASRPQDMAPDDQIIAGGNADDRWLYRRELGCQRTSEATCSGEAFATDATGGYIVGGNDRNCAFIYGRFNGTRRLQVVMETEFGLDLGGFEPISARGTSDDGRLIARIGDAPEGGEQAWVAYLPLLRCRGDFNRDGLPDSFDVPYYLRAYAAGDPEADLVSNGVFSCFDVATFLDLVSQGCL